VPVPAAGDIVTTLTWRQQAVAAFLSAQDGWRRSVTASSPALTALHAALDVAEEAIRAEVYDHLGHDHFVIFTEDGWTTEHSIECRLSGRMHECTIHSAIGRWANVDPPLPGRWRVVSAEGPVPVLERADPPATQTATGGH
jgi:hypothetical protein